MRHRLAGPSRRVRSVADGLEAAPPITRPTGRGTGSTESFWPKRTPPGWSIGRCRWTRPSTEPTSTARTFPAPQGELPNYKKLFAEPPDHAIGRSRGGLSTKIHHACDGKGRPLAMILRPGQGGDSPMFPVLMDHLRVPRPGGGRAEPAPGPCWATRRTHHGRSGHCCENGSIKAVIPEPSDQIGHRKRRGSRGGRPVASTPRPTTAATPSSETSTPSSNGVASPPATTNSHSPTEAASSVPSSSGYANKETRP